MSDLLDKVDDENAEYVFNVLHADTDSFISDKVCQELQDMTTVMLCLRQRLAMDYLDAIFDDFNAMKNFQPEFSATEAEGIPVEEAEQLLKNVRKKSLLQFQQSLEMSASAIEASIVQKHPFGKS